MMWLRSFHTLNTLTMLTKVIWTSVPMVTTSLSCTAGPNVRLKTTKIIDTFHLKNHISESCRRQFSPERVEQQYPDMNTQVGEQTFTWLYHFKHILCSMPKVHHLFYLHRMVVRRNQYTAKCYKYGKKPILPQK